ncbi:hypothetical protein GGF43_002626 [Coemansia sp. RSA 2618]|nr:hypothetical protein GGF43_002626 [Coemansia sp. RSA 2618]
MSKDGSGLSQTDFRKLLQTPRAPSTGDDEPRPRSTGVLGKRRMAHRPHTTPAKTGFEPRKKRPSGKTNKPNTTEKYRDRAAERRQGIAETEEPQSLHANAPVLEDVGMTSEQQRIYEQSKHLGGDTEHTHLVKGLDYLLLEKMRAQTDARRDGGLDMEIERLQSERNTDMVAREAITSLDAQTSVGIRVMGALSKIAKRPEPRNDLFLPGHMYFEFNLTPPLSTTVRIRSQDEVAQMLGVSHLSGLDQRDAGDGLVISKVISAIAARRNNRQAKKQHAPSRKEETAVAVPAQAVSIVDGNEEEEDIFADAGIDYEVTVDEATGPLPPSGMSSDSGSDDEMVVEPYPESADNSDAELVAEPYPESADDNDEELVAEPYPESMDDDENVAEPYPDYESEPH